MEAMANSLRESMMKTQQEMLQNFLEQMRAANMQNLGPTTMATSAGRGIRIAETNEGQVQDQNTGVEGGQQGLGGRPSGSDTGRPKDGAQQVGANAYANEPPEEYVPEFPSRLGGQDRNLTRGQPLDGDERMIGLMRRIMREGLPSGGVKEVSRSPFTPNIRNARNPPKFKLPTLEPYDGRSDPTMHITRYIRHMEVLGASEEVMARCFPLYLSDLAALWFRQLETGSIGTWSELVDCFMRPFRVHVTRPKSVMTLASIKQRTGEFIKDFLLRFNVTVTSVDRLDPSMILMAAVAGVAEGTKFKDSLTKDPPQDLGEFFHKAEKFIRLEESRIESREINTAQSEGTSREQSGADKGKRKQDDRHDGPNKRKKFREPRFRQYTDLTAGLERIYTETRGQLPYRKPPIRDPTERERRTGKYCLFHELDGHTTDECRHLKDEVEEHARGGRLPQFVRERTAAARPERLPPPPNRNDPGSGSRLVIN